MGTVFAVKYPVHTKLQRMTSQTAIFIQIIDLDGGWKG